LQQYARDNFSWDGVVLQWEALFVELLIRGAEKPVVVEQPKHAGPPVYEGVL
jgi:hypothetical protein